MFRKRSLRSSLPRPSVGLLPITSGSRKGGDMRGKRDERLSTHRKLLERLSYSGLSLRGRTVEGRKFMKARIFISALALGGLVAPGIALADDPNDPTMRNPANRARDAATIRQLNRDQAAYVEARDAQYAEGWQAQRDYERERAEYERRMAEWRRAVRLCEGGHHEYCRG